MIILSFDVGIVNLSYCVLRQFYNQDIEIIDWDIINLVEDEAIKVKCCGYQKKNNICNRKATYYLNVENKSYGFCKLHLSQWNLYWSNEKTQSLFQKEPTPNTCNYSNCDKSSDYIFHYNNEEKYYCQTHYRSVLRTTKKEFLPQPIKKLIVRKYPTNKLQLLLINKLDELSKHFSKLNIQEVIIENQPSQKNPKMKSIANTLFDYFLIRGYIDKIHLDINCVKFICPSNKLKVNNDNTIEVFKSNKDNKNKYKLTKQLSIKYTKQLLKNDEEQLQYLDLYEKQDDLCDAYLQGRYYLEILRKNTP